MGAAAQWVQPDAPGHTVPGAGPSSKFVKANDPPPPNRADRTPPSGNGADGRSALQAANRRLHPRAIKRFMTSLRVWWKVVAPTPGSGVAQVSHLRVAHQPHGRISGGGGGGTPTVA